jgi:hypothetical protein
MGAVIVAIVVVVVVTMFVGSVALTRKQIKNRKLQAPQNHPLVFISRITSSLTCS